MVRWPDSREHAGPDHGGCLLLHAIPALPSEEGRQWVQRCRHPGTLTPARSSLARAAEARVAGASRVSHGHAPVRHAGYLKEYPGQRAAIHASQKPLSPAQVDYTRFWWEKEEKTYRARCGDDGQAAAAAAPSPRSGNQRCSLHNSSHKCSDRGHRRRQL
jgi:hypothetical protein